MDRKSILFIIPWLPYPLKSGGHQALFNGIYAVRNDFEVHIAYEAENDDDYVNNEEEFLELIPNAHLYPFFYDSYNQYPYWLRIAYRVKAFIKKLLGRENGKADKVAVIPDFKVKIKGKGNVFDYDLPLWNVNGSESGYPGKFSTPDSYLVYDGDESNPEATAKINSTLKTE